MYVRMSDNRRCSKYAESPVFLRGSADGNDVSTSIFAGNKKVSGTASVLCQTSFGTEKTMTVRDVTGFCAFFFARKSGNFLHIFGRFPTKLYRKPGEKGNNPLEKIQKVHWRRRPQTADFCPLSWSNVNASSQHIPAGYPKNPQIRPNWVLVCRQMCRGRCDRPQGW